MLNNFDKAQTLLNIVGEHSSNVLGEMDQNFVPRLTSTIGEIINHSPKEMKDFVDEVVTKIEAIEARRMSQNLDGAFEEESSTMDEFGDDFSFDADEMEVPKVVKGDSRLRNISEIADILSRARPQVAAFVLSRVDESTREELMNNFPSDFRTQLMEQPVENVPIAPKVFNTIYDEVFLRKDGESSEGSEPEKEPVFEL
jgi:flagellar motor switch protein FliG